MSGRKSMAVYFINFANSTRGKDSCLIDSVCVKPFEKNANKEITYKIVEELKNMLTEKGKVFIAVPNYTSYDAKQYGEYWAAFDVPRHLYHFSPQSMKNLVEQHGLTIKKIKPMWFDSFYVSMLSEKYKNGKGNLVKAFLIGLASNFKTIFNSKKCSSLIYILEKS